MIRDGSISLTQPKWFSFFLSYSNKQIRKFVPQTLCKRQKLSSWRNFWRNSWSILDENSWRNLRRISSRNSWNIMKRISQKVSTATPVLFVMVFPEEILWENLEKFLINSLIKSLNNFWWSVRYFFQETPVKISQNYINISREPFDLI